MSVREIKFHGVGHPLIPSAAALWLCNDLIFKYSFPGVITGKLSDFCGVLVAPALLNFILRLFVPRALNTVSLSLTAVAIFMLLLKSNVWSNRFINSIVPMGICDPWDLISLVMLIPSYYILNARVANGKLVALPGLVLSIAASIATSQARDPVMMQGIPAIELTFSRDEPLFFLWYPDVPSDRYDLEIHRGEISAHNPFKKIPIESKDIEMHIDERLTRTTESRGTEKLIYYVFRPDLKLFPGEYSYVITALNVPPQDEESYHKTYYSPVVTGTFRILP